MEGKTTNRHVFLRMVREVEMSRDWFRSVFIVNLNIPKVFAETITQSAARFTDVYLFAQGTGNTIDEIGGNAREMISDGNSSLRSGDFVRVGDEQGQVLHRTRAHLNVPGLMIGISVYF